MYGLLSYYGVFFEEDFLCHCEKIVRKEGNIIIVRNHPLRKVGMAGKEISGRVCVTGDVFEGEIIFEEGLTPACLAIRDLMRLAEIDQIVVIGENLDGMVSA